MAWTAPFTAVAGTAFTAAQFNQYVRDNLNETAPAKVSAEGDYVVGTAMHSVAARHVAYDSSGASPWQTTNSTSYTDLADGGPIAWANSGTQAFVTVAAHMTNNTNNTSSLMSFDVWDSTAGESAWAADDANAAILTPNTNVQMRICASTLVTGLTAGNTFQFRTKYRVAGGIGSFVWRTIVVIPF